MADNVDDYVCTEYLIPNDTSDNTTFTSYPTLGAVKAAPTISGELVFFADDQGQAYAISVSGFAVWTYTAGGAVATKLAVEDVSGTASVNGSGRQMCGIHSRAGDQVGIDYIFITEILLLGGQGSMRIA